MIKFASENVDGQWIQWSFNSVQEISDEYYGDADLPSNDDYIFDVVIGDIALDLDSLVVRPAQFLDLLALLKIDIYDI